jgi:hypothetical protein
MRKLLLTAATAALVGIGLTSVPLDSAFARVVCNDNGDCWHTDSSYHYGVHVRTYPDTWYFHQDWDHDRDHHWRGHHEGRGYWRNGVWITF